MRPIVRHAVSSLVLSSLLLMPPVAAAGTPKLPGSSAVKSYRQLQWEDLIPKGWSPQKRLREMNPGMINDSDSAAKKAMRDAWDSAPTVKALNGQTVRLPGYVVPLEEANGELSEFLLVPYFGACIHSPPPPANQIVHVLAAKPVKGLRAMDVVWASGTLHTQRQDSYMGVSGYRLSVDAVEPYVPFRQ
ncbi:DUF3299 domain-containing protein [Chitinimonas koreensis]|uniref:DUF3299 domain-containing protein n=1 Tax=Chitinimonas koreensis TaxID=356302 RepID=UPI0006886F5E|nr:DUF3299 domain-containing protein [Chitinimonas koreensis]QNM98695.1 DUF3299 domain-containing protein [Chitinimonas koreensis]